MSKSSGAGRRSARRQQTHESRALDYEIRATRHGVSANHLLNFSLPEREKPVAFAKKKKKSGPSRTQSEFLHANFRFVVAPREDDVQTPFWDMEALTEWTSVEQVLLWHDEASPMSCPICLDDFRAPKITKCGHIFCWSCILRYLSLSDKYWRRCPMCFDSVQKGQLRSVRIEKVSLPPRVDSDATFQFLQRDKASFFPHLPTSSAGSVKKCPRKLPSVHDPAATFARILEADQEYVTQLLLGELRDLQALDAEFRSSGDVDSLPFVEEAMRATSGRLAQHDGGGLPQVSTSTSSDHQQRSSHKVPPETDEVYSFYQLSNGIYVVLHPLNMKCLLKEFAEPKPKDDREEQTKDEDVGALWAEAASLSGASCASEVPTGVRYDLLPERIHGRVLEVEHVVMDDDVRKRYRFLSHLPKFCDFYLCELDLSELLSPATLSAFRAEIKKRERQRKQKEQKSKRRVATSPVFKDSLRAGFSIEQAGMAWPAPSESSLTEAFEESLSLGYDEDRLGGGEGAEGESPSRSHLESPASPPSPAFPVYDEGSFATITRQSGYYPPLGSSGSSTTNGSAFGFDHARSPPPAAPWGMAGAGGSGAPPLFDLDLDALPRPSGKGKKGAGKKGLSLFSTSQHRSYR